MRLNAYFQVSDVSIFLVVAMGFHGDFLPLIVTNKYFLWDIYIYYIILYIIYILYYIYILYIMYVYYCIFETIKSGWFMLGWDLKIGKS